LVRRGKKQGPPDHPDLGIWDFGPEQTRVFEACRDRQAGTLTKLATLRHGVIEPTPMFEG
jgi:hypothetical protein